MKEPNSLIDALDEFDKMQSRSRVNRAGPGMAIVNGIVTISTGWFPVEGAPPDEWIEVCGPSGYKSTSHFLCLAQFSMDRGWIGVSGDRLSECGWEPTHWRMLGDFPSLPVEEA